MYYSRLEPTIDEVQAQIDRLNRTIREWRDQQAPQGPAEDRLSKLGDRGADILSRWEATDQRYSQAVNEIEERLAAWGAMESRLHRDALERVRGFERTMQGEWQSLRQMHEEPLRQLQEQAAALGETCVAAANLSLRGYERAEARLATLENDLRTQLTLLSQEVRTALVEVRRAALPPAAAAEPFPLDSVMRLHEELRQASPFPSEAVAPSRFSDGLRGTDGLLTVLPTVLPTIDLPRPVDIRSVEAAQHVEVLDDHAADVATRSGDVSWSPEPVRTFDAGEPVVTWPRPVPAPMPSAATAPAVAPDVRLSTSFPPSAVEVAAALPKPGPSRPDSAFPFNDAVTEVAVDRRMRHAERRVPAPASASNRVGRLAAAGVAVAVIVLGIVEFGRLQSAATQRPSGSTSSTSGAAAAIAEPVAPPAPVVAPPAVEAAAPLPAPDTAEVARQHTLEILGAPDVVRLLLAGVGTAEGATAQVMWSRAEGMIVTASRLPLLPQGMTYRLSLRGAMGNVPVTDFTPDASGRTRLVADNPAGMPSPVHGAVITIEALQASPGATGTVALERVAR